MAALPGAERRSFTPSASGAGAARASNTPRRRSAHSAVNSPRTAADPSGRCRTREVAFAVPFSRVVQGPVRVEPGVDVQRQRVQRLRVERARVGDQLAFHLDPVLGLHRCRAAPPPPARSPAHARPRSHRSACAAATSGNTGSSGSPVSARRGPAASAARTRAAASPGCRRSTCRNNAAIDARPTRIRQRPRLRLRDQPVPHRRQPPREPLHLPQRIQQLGVGTHGQIRGQQVIHDRMRAGQRDAAAHRSQLLRSYGRF